MQGEFSIIKGYGGSIADIFSVSNAHRARNQDFYVYTFTVSLLSYFDIGSRQGGYIRNFKEIQRVQPIEDSSRSAVPRPLCPTDSTQEDNGI